MPEELDYSPCPEELRYLWDWFLALSARRSNNGFGPNPLSFLEIESWMRLRRIELLPHELEAIEMLDSIYLANQPKPTKAAP